MCRNREDLAWISVFKLDCNYVLSYTHALFVFLRLTLFARKPDLMPYKLELIIYLIHACYCFCSYELTNCHCIRQNARNYFGRKLFYKRDCGTMIQALQDLSTDFRQSLLNYSEARRRIGRGNGRDHRACRGNIVQSKNILS